MPRRGDDWVVPGSDHDHVPVSRDLRTLAHVVVEQLNAEPALRREPRSTPPRARPPPAEHAGRARAADTATEPPEAPASEQDAHISPSFSTVFARALRKADEPHIDQVRLPPARSECRDHARTVYASRLRFAAARDVRRRFTVDLWRWGQRQDAAPKTGRGAPQPMATPAASQGGVTRPTKFVSCPMTTRVRSIAVGRSPPTPP
jgi:hypothetical protein